MTYVLLCDELVSFPSSSDNKEGAQRPILNLEIVRWGGVLPRKGVGLKKFDPPSKPTGPRKQTSSQGRQEISLGCPGQLEIFEKFVEKSTPGKRGRPRRGSSSF